MLKRVLIGLDEGPHADAALDTALFVQARFGAHLQFLTVRAQRDSRPLAPPAALADLDPLHYSMGLAYGEPTEALAQVALDGGAELIIVASRRRRIGGVTRRLVRQTDVPVLAVAPRRPLLDWPARILLAVDDATVTAPIRAALGWAAGQAESTLHVLTVCPPGGDADHPTAERALRDKVSGCAPAPDTEIQYRVVTGPKPYAEIVAEGRRVEAELVVMGTHALPFWARAFHRESVSGVLAGTRAPLLVVPGSVRKRVRATRPALEPLNATLLEVMG